MAIMNRRDWDRIWGLGQQTSLYTDKNSLDVCSLLLRCEINSIVPLIRHVQPMAQPGSALHHHSGSCSLSGPAGCTPITQQQPAWNNTLGMAQASQKLDAHAVNNKTIASWLHNFFGCLWPSTGSGRGLQGGPCEKRPAYWLFLDFLYFPGVLEGFTKCEHYGWQQSKEQPRAPRYIFTSKYLHAQLTSQPSPKLTLRLTHFLA